MRIGTALNAVDYAQWETVYEQSRQLTTRQGFSMSYLSRLAVELYRNEAQLYVDGAYALPTDTQIATQYGVKDVRELGPLHGALSVRLEQGTLAWYRQVFPGTPLATVTRLIVASEIPVLENLLPDDLQNLGRDLGVRPDNAIRVAYGTTPEDWYAGERQ